MKRPLHAVALMALSAMGCEPRPEPARPLAASGAPDPAPPPTSLAEDARSVEADSGRADAASPDARAGDPEDAAGPRSGSNTVRSRDGRLVVTGHDRHARHTHGGAPARIGNVTFTVANDGDRPRKLTCKSVDFLRDHGCEAPASTIVSHPKLSGLAFERDDDLRTTTSLELPAKSSLDVRVFFEPVEAYYTYCDRFAIRVHLGLDGGESLAPTAELLIMRMEPVER